MTRWINISNKQHSSTQLCLTSSASKNSLKSGSSISSLWRVILFKNLKKERKIKLQIIRRVIFHTFPQLQMLLSSPLKLHRAQIIIHLQHEEMQKK